MKKLYVLLFCLGAYGVRSTLFSAQPVSKARSEQNLYDTIRRRKVAIAYIDHQAPMHEQKNRSYSGRNRRCTSQAPLLQTFAALSKSGYYPKGAVAFVRINSATPFGQQFLQDNGIADITTPCIVLFTDGVLVEDQNGPVQFAGSMRRQELKKKIDAYINLDIASYVEQERLCNRYERIMRDRVHLYYTPYFSHVANPWNGYWGWPYYGMAQGNYGGNAGVVMGNGGMSFFGSNY